MSETKLYILKLQKNFSKRLNQLLCQRGFGSNVANIGSAKILSSIVECSIPMARRYLLGKGIPGKIRLEKLASWAGVSKNWLIFGSDSECPEINEKLLSEIILTLRTQVFFEKNEKEKLKEYIDFSLEVYNKVNRLSSSDTEKIEIAKMMIESINLTLKFSKNFNVVGY